jgi:RNA polymerase sigma-B factor
MSRTPAAGDDLHEQQLWQRLNRERDQRARAELVEIYLPVARRMAGRYAGVVEPYDDLVQVASLGLLNAIDRYELDRRTPFIGFAKPTIMGELKRYFRDKVWAVRVPRALHDRMAAIDKVAERLTEELARPPSTEELAEALGLEVDEVLETLVARENRRPVGIDAPVQGEDGEGPTTAEWLGREDANYDLVEDRIAVEAVLPSLDRREREVLYLRFVEDLPQSQIARRIGCSQMHVSRLLRATLDRLREEAVNGAPGKGVGGSRESLAA